MQINDFSRIRTSLLIVMGCPKRRIFNRLRHPFNRFRSFAMASIINSNISSLTAQRNLSMSQASLSVSMQRLSSGLRINSAKDDAAGLSIADRMTAQIRGSIQASRNSNDGISLSQVAEGALNSASTMLQRIRELAVQSANDTNTAADRKSLQAETGQLLTELDRIGTNTQFNGRNILDGSLGSATFQVGANANQTITATTSNFRTSVYGAQLAQSALISAVQGVPADLNAISLGGDIVVNGMKTQTVTLTANDTASTAAATFNAIADVTGVTAVARNWSEFKPEASGPYALAVTGSSTTHSNITFNVSATDTSAGLAEAVKAFNDVSSQTGITAKLNSTSNGIILYNDAGDDIKMTNNSLANTISLAAYDARTSADNGVDTFDAAATGIAPGADVASRGTLEFNSDKGFSFGSDSTSALAVLPPYTSTLNAVSSIDISTVEGSTRTLKIVDSAINAVDSQRASFGALQSRFESSIANLQVNTENLSAARSRIQDADFAMETSNLSRAQILQQAGTAMVAQANQLPQGVMALLK
jgi:flagellin